MRLLVKVAMAAVLVAGLAMAKPNFSGTWKLNAGKSDFGQFPGPSAMTQTVTHEDPSLKSATKMSTDNGDREMTSTYSTDGQETKNAFGPNEMKSVAKWVGEVLEIETKGSFGDAEVTISDAWALSADGKVLTVKRKFKSSMGEMEQKMVLEKQ